MQNQINHLYRFEPFLLDANERLLMRDGKVVPLPPRVIDTLLILVENSGRVLEKDELMQTLWPDVSVEESNLTQNISQIRRALGEGDWIETIPKRGYRFAAQVQIEVADDHAAAESGNGLSPISLHKGGNTFNGAAGEAALPDDEIQYASVRQTRSLSVPANPETLPARARASLLLKKHWRLTTIVCVGLVVFGLALFLLARRAPTQADNLFRQFGLAKLTTSGQVLQAAVSHDGRYVAFVEGMGDARSLLVRQVRTTSQVVLVAPADTKYLGVTFAPDDNFIYYTAQVRGEASGTLFQIPLLGGAPKKLLAGTDSPVAVSPDGQHVAFVRMYPAQKESALLLANPDGTQERKLLIRKRPEIISLHGPAWSPDGKLIVCAAGNGVSGESDLQMLAISPADGQVSAIGNQTWSDIGQPAWLNDGSGLVFNAWRSSSAVYGDPLWLLTYPQGEVQQITNDLTNYDNVGVSADSSVMIARQSSRISRLWLAPVPGMTPENGSAKQIQAGFGDNYSDQLGLGWTPDGRLLFASHASGNLDIWVSNPAGRQQQLTQDKHSDLMPVATADGRYIVFVSDRGGTRAIWRMDVDGNNPQQLTRGKGDASPSLSPDGKWIVYSSWQSDHPTLWKVAIDGGEPVLLTSNTSFHPVISPDGKWIACFQQDEKDFRYRLVIIPFAGGEPSEIRPAAFPEYGNICWTPDSRALCYIVTRQGVSNLWRSPVGGGTPDQITSFASDQIFRFAWSRDGKTLACERGLTIGNIVLIGNHQAE